MPGVTPAVEAPSALEESASPLPPSGGSAATLPAPASSGITVAPPPAAGAVAMNLLDDAEYGAALAEVAEVADDAVLPILPNGAGYAALAATGERVAGAVEFIEVGPISVVLNGVSPPPPGADSIEAPGFSGPGGDAGPL